MKLRNLASALRNEPLPALIGEAGWRGIRSIRRSIFKLARAGWRLARFIFHPIGYYRLQTGSVSEHARKAILAYADAILRGEYPLMGYGSPSSRDEPRLAMRLGFRKKLAGRSIRERCESFATTDRT